MVRPRFVIFGRYAAVLGVAVLLLSSAPSAVLASVAPEDVITRLDRIYRRRTDLQKAFRSDDWSAYPATLQKGLADLEDWARRYGWREHPDELKFYAPAAVSSNLSSVSAVEVSSQATSTPPRALKLRSGAPTPKLKEGAQFDFGSVTADAVFVADVGSRDTLLAHNSNRSWTLASLTKLMTAMVALDRKLPLGRLVTLAKEDEVGGVRLGARTGSRYPVRDLFYAMIVGSTNNAAHAVARASGLEEVAFIKEMNAKAAKLGLTTTKFADPTGMDPANVSTAREVAALGLEAFNGYYEIKKAATTAHYDLWLAGATHRIKNTDDLLTDETNGLYVLGGKTGYLEESLWNLAVELRAAGRKPLMVVVLGSDTKDSLFRDAEKIARWTWNNYTW